VASTDLAQATVEQPLAPAHVRVKPADDLTTLLVASEWVFILFVIALVIAFKSYNPLMNAGLGLWAGTWVARWLRTGHVTRATPLELPLLGFGASLFIAAWIAPDQREAFTRTALFLAAIGLFYVLVNSSVQVLKLFSWIYLGFAALFGLYFASQHPWAAEPAKLAIFQKLGLWLNGHVPSLLIYDPHPNVVAGMLGIACAIWLGLAWHGLSLWKTDKWVTHLGLLGMLGLGAVLGFGLLMTQSRAGWLAVAGAMALACAWLLSGRLVKLIKLPQWAIFLIGLGFVVGLTLGVVIGKPQIMTTVFGTLPGPNSAVSRLDIYKQVWLLAQDAPFTGAGLGSFPALYSTFILSIPNLFLTHAHNSWLNLLVEQGWLGAGAYTLALGLVAWYGLVRLNVLQGWQRALVAAGLMGLTVIILNGLADATLVASRVIPVLFIPAGLVLSGAIPLDYTWKFSGWWLIPVAILAVIGLLFNRQLAAQWYANWGAVEQNRIVLAGWPTNRWNDTNPIEALQPAQRDFGAALALQPDNRTALYRRGLIAMSALDFQTAAGDLQKVYEAEPEHRGVIKTLGYAYVWGGELDRAVPLLASIPESRDELKVYNWWWLHERGRSDLAKNALILLGRMP